VVTEKAPSPVTDASEYYQDFRIGGDPVFFDMLTVDIECWGFAGDGNSYSTGPPPVGFIVSATLPDTPPTGTNIFDDGVKFGTRSFDFSGIAVSYAGTFFDSVAVLFATHGQTINVLCKRRTPTA